MICIPDWIRTNDPQLRRLLLYPAELSDRIDDGILLPSSRRTPIRPLGRNHVQCCRLHLRFAFGLFVPLLRTSILFRPHQRYTSLDLNLVLVLSICASHSADQCIHGGGGGYCTHVRNVYSIRLNDLSKLFIFVDNSLSFIVGEVIQQKSLKAVDILFIVL